MIEVKIKCKTELEAYEVVSFCALHQISVDIKVVKKVNDGTGKMKDVVSNIEFSENGFIRKFINEKPQRKLPKIIERKAKKVTNKHI